MAEVLASLKKIGGNGEQYTETVLWTNPSPTADFAAQTITLSDSISKYKYIGIKYCYAKTNTDIVDTAIYKTEEVRTSVIDGAHIHNIILLGVENANNYGFARIVGYVSDTSIKFTLGYRLNAATTTSNAANPLEILGINELAHQTVVGKYAVTDIQKITANTVATFATKGKALAIWFTFGNRSSSVLQAFTNVNPTTGEINNNEVYYAYYSGTSQLAQWTLTTNTFIVTDNSISTSASLSSSDRWGYIGYTYE